MTVKVLVADAHTLVRQGIVKLLTAHSEIEVVAEASNGFDVLTLAQEHSPDAVLMDRYLPGMDGIATTRLIKRDLPDVQVVLLSVSVEEDDIIEAVRAGARGYVPKSTDAAALIKQLKQVVSGGVALSEEMTFKLVAGLSHSTASFSRGAQSAPSTALTEREKDVLVLITQGKTNKDISTALVVSENTVRSHVRSLMVKLDMDNRTQLAVYGLREGFGLTIHPQTPPLARPGVGNGNGAPMMRTAPSLGQVGGRMPAAIP